MKVYTDEHAEWLKANCSGKYWSEILKDFNSAFNLSISGIQLKAFAQRLHLKNGLQHARRAHPGKRLLTDEEKKIFKKNNAGHTAKEMQQFCREHFNKEFSPEQIKGIRARLHLDSGLTGYFPKGHIPENKGKKLTPEVYEKVSKTMFKKGHISTNNVPLWSKRKTKDGYLEIKVRDGCKQYNWMLYQRYVYEQAYGPLKDEDIIIFLDGNKENCSLNNLMKISRAEHSTINCHYENTDDPELKKLIALTVRLKQKTKKELKNEKS